MNTEQSILSAWRAGLAETAQDPDLKKQLAQGQEEVLPRFAAHYEKLKRLPRCARRSLQRHWKRSLAGVALLLALGQAPVLAATINIGGTCTLVKAIVAANNNTSATGHCKKGSGADRIVLPRNSTQTLTAVNNDVYEPTGLPVIRTAITIDGNGSTINRAPTAPSFRILAVSASGNLKVQATTISGGVAEQGGGRSGGGLLNYGVVSLIGSTVSGNTAYGGGGGVNNFGGTVSLTNSTISGNNAGGGGGGILSLGFEGDDAFLTLTNSTVSGNTTSSHGGGVFSGGNAGVLTLINSTFVGNIAELNGGGVNSEGSVNLIRTLVSGNTASKGSELYVVNGFVPGDFNLFGHRGITSATALRNFTPGPTDIIATLDGNTPTKLSAILNTKLANNGGPTRTHALVAGSPAVDAVNDGTCPPPARDQRGVKRPRDGNGDGGPACDVGSFER